MLGERNSVHNFGTDDAECYDHAETGSINALHRLQINSNEPDKSLASFDLFDFNADASKGELCLQLISLAATSSVLHAEPSATCLELALEGERLSRKGDYASGISYYMAALCRGTDDPRLLSAIYSQLGNAHFYLQDYMHALEYHRWDLTLARRMGDTLGEAKASGNLGNTLKLLGKHDEAIVCCQRHLEIVCQLDDVVSEARALFNLGSAYVSRGKRYCRVNTTSSELNSGIDTPACNSVRRLGMEFYEILPEAKEYLHKAIECYELNLQLVRKLKDRATEGRVYSNLGNTYYLLGRFDEALRLYQFRLQVAREFGDTAAQRLTHTNMADAQIFLQDLPSAIQNYQQAYRLARKLADESLVAQACHNLGNTSSIAGWPLVAIVYHLRQLAIARRLNDQLTECRAAWSLTNAHLAAHHAWLENAELLNSALFFALLYNCLAESLQDTMGCTAARVTLRQIHRRREESLFQVCLDYPSLLNLDADTFIERVLALDVPDRPQSLTIDQRISTTLNWIRERQASHPSNCSSECEGDSEALLMDEVTGNTDVVVLTLSEDRKQCTSYPISDPKRITTESYDEAGNRVISRGQASPGNPAPATTSAPSSSGRTGVEDEELFLNLLAQCQSRRLNEQRCDLTGTDSSTRRRPASQSLDRDPIFPRSQSLTDEAFFDLIAGAQRSRMDDQRANLPPVFPGLRVQPSTGEANGRNCSGSAEVIHNAGDVNSAVPDVSFLDMIMRRQREARIEDQRTTFPVSVTEPSSDPSEDFLDMLQRIQSARLDEQRCVAPSSATMEPDASSSTRESRQDSVPEAAAELLTNAVPSKTSRFLSRIGSGKKKH